VLNSSGDLNVMSVSSRLEGVLLLKDNGHNGSIIPDCGTESESKFSAQSCIRIIYVHVYVSINCKHSIELLQ